MDFHNFHRLMTEDDSPSRYDDYDTPFFRISWTINRVSASLSIIGSSYILHDILRDSKKKEKFSNHIMAVLSFMDLLSSFFAAFLLQWPAPRGTAPGSIGNNKTCTAAGIFGGLGFFCSTYYNASLAICYLLMVRYGWNEQRLRKEARPFLLFVPLLLVLPLLILSLAWQGGNFNDNYCAILVPSPQWCFLPDSDVECERGERLGETIYSTPLGYLLLLLHVIISLPIIVACMTLLYRTVLQQEQANDRYRFGGQVDRTQSKLVGMQGIYYVWAFLIVELSWLSQIVLTAMGIVDGNSHDRYSYVTSFTTPLQGFLNACVFLRPRYMEYLRQHPERTWGNLVRRLFGRPLRLPENDSSCNHQRTNVTVLESNLKDNDNRNQQADINNENIPSTIQEATSSEQPEQSLE